MEEALFVNYLDFTLSTITNAIARQLRPYAIADANLIPAFYYNSLTFRIAKKNAELKSQRLIYNIEESYGIRMSDLTSILDPILLNATSRAIDRGLYQPEGAVTQASFRIRSALSSPDFLTVYGQELSKLGNGIVNFYDVISLFTEKVVQFRPGHIAEYVDARIDALPDVVVNMDNYRLVTSTYLGVLPDIQININANTGAYVGPASDVMRPYVRTDATEEEVRAQIESARITNSEVPANLASTASRAPSSVEGSSKPIEPVKETEVVTIKATSSKPVAPKESNVFLWILLILLLVYIRFFLHGNGFDTPIFSSSRVALSVRNS